VLLDPIDRRDRRDDRHDDDQRSDGLPMLGRAGARK